MLKHKFATIQIQPMVTRMIRKRSVANRNAICTFKMLFVILGSIIMATMLPVSLLYPVQGSASALVVAAFVANVHVRRRLRKQCSQSAHTVAIRSGMQQRGPICIRALGHLRWPFAMAYEAFNEPATFRVVATKARSPCKEPLVGRSSKATLLYTQAINFVNKP